MSVAGFFRPMRRGLVWWLYEQNGTSSRLNKSVRIGIASGFSIGGIMLYLFLTRDDTGDVSFASQTLFNLQASEKAQKLLGSPAKMKIRAGSYVGHSSMFFGDGSTRIKIIVDGEQKSALVEAMANRKGFYWATQLLKAIPIVPDSCVNANAPLYCLDEHEEIIIVNEIGMQ